MKRGKAAGPDEMTLEMVLALGEEGIVWLQRVLDAIWKEKRTTTGWNPYWYLYIRIKETSTSVVTIEGSNFYRR